MITTNVNGQPISQAFIDQIRSDSPDVISRILLNGSVLSADIRNWTLEKGSVASSEQFSTGDAIGFKFTAEVANLASNIKGEELEIQVGAWTGSAYEYIRLGYVTVKECSKIRQTVNVSSIVAYGRIVTRTKGQITVSGAVTISKNTTKMRRRDSLEALSSLVMSAKTGPASALHWPRRLVLGGASRPPLVSPAPTGQGRPCTCEGQLTAVEQPHHFVQALPAPPLQHLGRHKR